jgi:hypothetical protein
MQARVLQYLAQYLPKADKSITTVLDIFKLPIPEPTQGMPPDLLSFAFPITGRLQSLKPKPTADEIIENLYLQVKFRVPFAQTVLSHLHDPAFSAVERQYFATLLLHSCSCLLLAPVESIGLSDFAVLVGALRNAIPCFLDQNLLFQNFVCLIFERFFLNEDCLDYWGFLKESQGLFSENARLTGAALGAHGRVLMRMLSNGLLGEKFTPVQISIAASALAACEDPVDADCRELSRFVGGCVDFLKDGVDFGVVYAAIELTVALAQTDAFMPSHLDTLLKLCVDGSTLFDIFPCDAVFAKRRPSEVGFEFRASKCSEVPDHLNTDFSDLLGQADDFLIIASVRMGSQLRNLSALRCFCSVFEVLRPHLTQFDVRYHACLFVTIITMDLFQEEIVSLFAEHDIWEIRD